MYYTIYRITNIINNMIYVGAHQTIDLNDDYMGSGDRIKRAVKKYGVDNFQKQYISFHLDLDDMFGAESVIVNEEFIQREDTYNITLGGKFGDPVKAGKVSGNLHRRRLKEDKEYAENFSERSSIIMKLNNEQGKMNSRGFLGKKHTNKTILQMKESHKGKHSGSKNSQYGTMWIYSTMEKMSRKIKKEEFLEWEIKGWLKGRKMSS